MAILKAIEQIEAEVSGLQRERDELVAQHLKNTGWKWGYNELLNKWYWHRVWRGARFTLDTTEEAFKMQRQMD